MRRPRHRRRPGHPLSGPAREALRLQPLTRARLASLGEAGQEWFAGLPDLLAGLEEQWSVRVGRPLPGGSASYVARATRPDGTPLVVKVQLPDPDLADESRTLAAARGRGYAHLHAHDPRRRALLLEALGPSLEHTPLPPERKLEVLADTLREAWQVPLDSAPAVGPGEDKASTLRALVVDLDERLAGACPPRVLAQALEYADRRAAAFDADACVVVHGDPHPHNTLRVPEPRPGAESGYCFVDPDGFRADPAYDLGVVVRDWTGLRQGADFRRDIERFCALLAERTGVDRTAIWEWGFLERVSTGLFVTGFGATAVGRPFLESAEDQLDT